MLTTILLTSLLSASSGGDPTCNAGDARLNQPGDPLKSLTYDFIPLVPDASLVYYQVYSARNGFDGSPTVGNNVNVSLIHLGGNRVLMFGSGYGDHPVALFGAATDAGLVDEVIQGCIGLEPGSTRIHFVAPHGHPDHVNAEIFRELRLLGYRIAEIAFHEGDLGLVNALPGWTAQDMNAWNVLSGPDCGVVRSFQSTVGRVRFQRRSGHTDGSLDMVIDVQNDPDRRVLVRGSAPNMTCAVPPGVKVILLAHGNAIL